MTEKAPIGDPSVADHKVVGKAGKHEIILRRARAEGVSWETIVFETGKRGLGLTPEEAVDDLDVKAKKVDSKKLKDATP